VDLIYARWIDVGSRLALAVLLASFAAYVLGVFEPLIPLERLPALWRLPAAQFVAQSGAPAGWGWLAHLGQGDYLNFAGIALLATGTLVAYLRLLIWLAGRGERLFATLVLAQALVLIAAASGFAAPH
jgi:hypothetical protein